MGRDPSQSLLEGAGPEQLLLLGTTVWPLCFLAGVGEVTLASFFLRIPFPLPLSADNDIFLALTFC